MNLETKWWQVHLKRDSMWAGYSWTFESKSLLNQMLIIVYSFLATGESFWMLHICFRRGVSTIASAVYEVCDAIYSVLQPIYMVPPTEDDWRQIEHRFRSRWNFPNCVGVIDGKHTTMKKPPNSQSLFYN